MDFSGLKEAAADVAERREKYSKEFVKDGRYIMKFVGGYEKKNYKRENYIYIEMVIVKILETEEANAHSVGDSVLFRFRENVHVMSNMADLMSGILNTNELDTELGEAFLQIENNEFAGSLFKAKKYMSRWTPEGQGEEYSRHAMDVSFLTKEEAEAEGVEEVSPLWD